LSFGPRWEFLLRKNPVLARELRQATRTGRAVLLLLILAVLVGLFTLGLGSILNMTRSASVGPLLFQIFFSLSYFIVGIVGPALSAVGLASERDGRTWDALLLTGMDIRAIARGKFLASTTALGLFLLMIAPASLLCSVLGGVRLGEILVAFVLLAIIAVLSAAFGTSVGARSYGTVSATFIALVSALAAVPLLYFGVGVGFSFLAHATWPEVPMAAPVWLPLAYERSRLDGWYLLLLIVLPLLVSTLALWFFYEMTVARLLGESDDRASGLKRWYLVSLPLVAAIAAVPGWMTRGPSRLGAFLGGLGGLLLFLVFCAFVFAGDALGVSRRIEFRWQQRGAGWLARVMGPGLVQTSMLLLVSSLLIIGLFALGGAAMLSGGTRDAMPPPTAVSLLTCGEVWSAFFVFIVGFLVWSRVRANSVGGARVLTLFVGALAMALPWIGFLIFGYALSKRVHDALIIAAPSPLYAFTMVSAILRGDPQVALTAGLACSLGWIAMGLTLFGLGARRATRLVAERRTRELAFSGERP
jgi:hypothetical protein